MESPVTPPWSLILPRLEERANQKAARMILDTWVECAALCVAHREAPYVLTRLHGQRAAEGMRELLGPAAAAAEVQRAWDSIPWPLGFKGRRHILWRLYMFVKGVALHGYRHDPPPCTPGWEQSSLDKCRMWEVECLIEGGRTGVYGAPPDGAPYVPFPGVLLGL